MHGDALTLGSGLGGGLLLGTLLGTHSTLEQAAFGAALDGALGGDHWHGCACPVPVWRTSCHGTLGGFVTCHIRGLGLGLGLDGGGWA